MNTSEVLDNVINVVSSLKFDLGNLTEKEREEFLDRSYKLEYDYFLKCFDEFKQLYNEKFSIVCNINITDYLNEDYKELLKTNFNIYYHDFIGVLQDSINKSKDSCDLVVEIALSILKYCNDCNDFEPLKFLKYLNKLKYSKLSQLFKIILIISFCLFVISMIFASFKYLHDMGNRSTTNKKKGDSIVMITFKMFLTYYVSLIGAYAFCFLFNLYYKNLSSKINFDEDLSDDDLDTVPYKFNPEHHNGLKILKKFHDISTNVKSELYIYTEHLFYYFIISNNSNDTDYLLKVFKLIIESYFQEYSIFGISNLYLFGLLMFIILIIVHIIKLFFKTEKKLILISFLSSCCIFFILYIFILYIFIIE